MPQLKTAHTPSFSGSLLHLSTVQRPKNLGHPSFVSSRLACRCSSMRLSIQPPVASNRLQNLPPYGRSKWTSCLQMYSKCYADPAVEKQGSLTRSSTTQNTLWDPRAN